MSILVTPCCFFIFKGFFVRVVYVLLPICLSLIIIIVFTCVWVCYPPVSHFLISPLCINSPVFVTVCFLCVAFAGFCSADSFFLDLVHFNSCLHILKATIENFALLLRFLSGILYLGPHPYASQTLTSLKSQYTITGHCIRYTY